MKNYCFDNGYANHPVYIYNLVFKLHIYSKRIISYILYIFLK